MKATAEEKARYIRNVLLLISTVLEIVDMIAFKREMPTLFCTALICGTFSAVFALGFHTLSKGDHKTKRASP